MKNLLLLFISCFLLLQCSVVIAQTNKVQTKNDLEEENLKGNIKSIIEITYKAINKSGVIQKGESDRKIITLYNRKGNIIEDSWYDPKTGKLFDKWSYKYDSLGKLIKYTRKGISVSTYIYNKKGYLMKINENGDPQSTHKYIYKYDIKGNQIEENFCGPDENGDFTYCYRYTFKYDIRGNQIEKNQYDPDGNLEYKMKYEYDNKGNLIQETEYKLPSFSLILIFTYKYDSFGNKIEWGYYSFNDKGKIQNDFIKKYIYKFDNKGNWIQCIEYVNGISSTIIERQIEYY